MYFRKKKKNGEHDKKKMESSQIFSELQGETKFLNFVSEWISTTESKARKLAKRQARERARKSKKERKKESKKAWNGISLTPTFTLTCN